MFLSIIRYLLSVDFIGNCIIVYFTVWLLYAIQYRYYRIFQFVNILRNYNFILSLHFHSLVRERNNRYSFQQRKTEWSYFVCVLVCQHNRCQLKKKRNIGLEEKITIFTSQFKRLCISNSIFRQIFYFQIIFPLFNFSHSLHIFLNILLLFYA